MKKVIIALLVIASLFAFVSCKEANPWDKFLKLPTVDTSTEKGAIVVEVFDLFASSIFGKEPDLSLSEKEYVYTLEDDTVTITVKPTDIEYTPVSDVTDFVVSVSYSDSEKSLDFYSYWDESNDEWVCCEPDTEATTTEDLIELTEDKTFAKSLIVLLENSNLEAIASESEGATYSASYCLNEEVSGTTTGEKPTTYTITDLTIEVSGNGYVEKDPYLDIFNPTRADSATMDYVAKITYEDSNGKEKKFSATYSTGYDPCSCIMGVLVKYDGKQYKFDIN